MKNNIPASARLIGSRNTTAHGGECQVSLDGQRLHLEESLRYCSKSPTGFNWGYGGSGPSQLAHEVCRKLYGLKIAGQVFHAFKFRFITTITGDSFDMTLDLAEFNAAHVLPLVDEEEETNYDRF